LAPFPVFYDVFADITKLFFHGGECNIVARTHLKNTKLSLPHNTTTSKYTYMIALKNTSFCALADFLTSLSESMKTPIKYLDLRGPNEITTVVISLSFSHNYYYQESQAAGEGF